MERRLIYANALMKNIGKIPQLRGITYGRMKKAVEDAPTISAVEVVRCRECKHRKDPFVCPMCGECVAPEGEDWGVHDWAEDDGFCHKGERREPDGE